MQTNQRTVLVVEDEANDRLLLQEMLAADGLAVAEIEAGKGIRYDSVVADASLKLFREKGFEIPA